METRRVRLTFIDDILGTASSDPKIHRSYIASKAPDAPSTEEEVAALGVDEVTEKGMTVFQKDEEGNPVLFNYQIKGFFKSACSALRPIEGTKSSKCRGHKKHIDLRIFVFHDAKDRAGRKIPIVTDEEMGDCQRPLRAQTMQGERVALANSESVHSGAHIEFDIVMLDDKDVAMVEEWLDYGSLNGIGQWRNSGKGAFTWEYVGEQKPKRRGRPKKAAATE